MTENEAACNCAAFYLLKELKMKEPIPTDYPEFYQKYINEVIDEEIITYLSKQIDFAVDFFKEIGEEKSKHKYAEGKWSIKEILGHINDCERLFAARALHFARNEKQNLVGFDEDNYVEFANFDELSLTQLVEDFKSMRNSTLSLFSSFNEAMWNREGVANGVKFSVAAIAYIIAGHFEHHIKVIEERYL